jgi:hypothetical protein
MVLGLFGDALQFRQTVCDHWLHWVVEHESGVRGCAMATVSMRKISGSVETLQK